MDDTDNVYMQPRPQLTTQPSGPQLTTQPSGAHQQMPPGQQLVAQQYVITINGNVNTAPHGINPTAIHITAAIQLSCTGLCVLLGIVAILVGCLDADFAMPIWMGLCFFMVAGILGKVAASKKSNCWIVSYMVLSIIASIAAAVLVLNMFTAALHEDYVFTFTYTRNSPYRISSAGAASIDGAVCIIALVEMITAIVASAFCCKGTCCVPANPVQVQYSPGLHAGSVMLPTQQGQGQTMMITQGQTLMMNPISLPQPAYNTLPINEAPPIPDKYNTLAEIHTPEEDSPVYSVPHSIRRTPPVDDDGADESGPPVDDDCADESDDSVGHEISLDDGTDQQPLVK